MFGCGSPETTSAPTEPEKTAIAESKAAWDQTKVDAFKKAHAEEGRLTPGQKAAGGSKPSDPNAAK